MKADRALKTGAILALLFAAALSWAWVIESRLARGPGLRDISEYLDNRRALITGDVRITAAGDWGMGQTLREGDLALWVPAWAGRIEPGDIVLWGRENSIAAGRVVSTENGRFLAAGDSGGNPYPVEGREILGVVVGVIYRR